MWLWWDYSQNQLLPYVEQQPEAFQDVELNTQHDVAIRLYNPRRDTIRLVGKEFS
jgi:hypothetical protein